MTRRRFVTLGLALALAGCTYYPTVRDVGGLRIRPVNGKLVQTAGNLEFYVDLRSTARCPDLVLSAELDGAKKAQLVGPSGQQLASVEIPGETVTRFHPNGPHVVFSDVQRALKSGDVVLVTLYFQKYGPMGVVTTVE
ncbi:MAG: copper chaperone PCu(A)C [Candidatus Rokubacteria bacterium]|nr:copper chaperone PCu(A)C [Candidatus Rokubacteria bacterium]